MDIDRTVVNLRAARKHRDRSERKAAADANALRFGLSKGERVLQATLAERMKRKLDQLKFDEE